MLWSLLSSAFIIYLYRTLDAKPEPQSPEGRADDLGSTLDALNQRLATLENHLPNAANKETAQ